MLDSAGVFCIRFSPMRDSTLIKFRGFPQGGGGMVAVGIDSYIIDIIKFPVFWYGWFLVGCFCMVTNCRLCLQTNKVSKPTSDMTQLFLLVFPKHV